MASELGPENLVDVDGSPHKLLLPIPGQDPPYTCRYDDFAIIF